MIADNVDLICKADKSIMARVGDSYHCAICTAEYPIRDGVAVSVVANDEFYEGAYDNTIKFVPRSERPWHAWPLWLLNSGYVWEARRQLPEGATVIELGCAAGVRYFGKRYRMIGCDLNFAALRKIDFYELKVQADAAAHIPLPDRSVDGVVSSFFWEHIPPALKPGILAECRRVLKPGGRMVFLYDVETANPRIARYKRMDRALYDRLFIEGDGHFGYQTPAENVALFEGAGFELVRHKGMEKTWIQSPSVIEKLRKFARSPKPARPASNPLAFYLSVAMMRLIDNLICPLLPARWARIDLVVLRKGQ
jgi:SAM-dependent methyltransferase